VHQKRVFYAESGKFYRTWGAGFPPHRHLAIPTDQIPNASFPLGMVAGRLVPAPRRRLESFEPGTMKGLCNPRKAVFIDRDGTINVDVHYLSTPPDLILYPGVAEGIATLARSGFLIIIITNQSGIARGNLTHEMLGEIHKRLHSLVEESGGRIDAIYYCPHHPDEKCACRKPQPGMLQKAISDLHIDPKQSFIIGDRMLDVEAGKAVGLKAVLIPEAAHEAAVEEEKKKSAAKADFECRKFPEAVKFILRAGGYSAKNDNGLTSHEPK
jgi:D-glycero-D-manno-heptose 1,7-bisphosphate phosphatase